MAANGAARQYWDSGVFLAWLKAEPGRSGVIDRLMAAVELEEISVCTSALTIAELAHAATGAPGAADPSLWARVDRLWAPPSLLRLASVNPIVAIEARALSLTASAKGVAMSPADAIHLATARKLGAKFFFTFDRVLLDLGGPESPLEPLGFKIIEPYADRFV